MLSGFRSLIAQMKLMLREGINKNMLQNISLAEVDTYFEQGKLTNARTTLGPIGPPPPDKYQQLESYKGFVHEFDNNKEY